MYVGQPLRENGLPLPNIDWRSGTGYGRSAMSAPDSPAADGAGSAVTVLLRRWATGDKSALDALIPVVQAELKRLAGSYMRRERAGHTLDATALVNESYLRLVD